MDIRVIDLMKSDGSVGFCLAVNGLIMQQIYMDRDHAMNAGRLLIPGFDEYELGFDTYEAIPSDGFPQGFLPFQWRRGKISMGLIVWGPSGMMSRGYDKVPNAISVCATIESEHKVKLNPKSSARKVVAPKGL